MKRVMLIYPPGQLYQRGEDRCQANISHSSATNVRACNDLGYASALLVQAGYDVFLKDYQTENKDLNDLIADFKKYKPDALFMSITNATIFQDLEVLASVKKADPSLMIIIKGAIFFNPENELLNELDLKDIDYIIGGESDFIVDKIVQAHYGDKNQLDSINGILYKTNDTWKRTSFKCWETDLDSYPFPDRSRMNNDLYIRPDTEEPQATITTSRGCPSACIYCMTPVISGKMLRCRSPQSIFNELKECYEKYNIHNFFFKSDTFTYDAKWVQKLCDLIINSPLKNKIEWVANSRTKPLNLETLKKMKQAGCWLIAFGYESGHMDTLKGIKKGTTVADNLKAAELAKQAGLKTFGFFLIGLPWENKEHLNATRKHIFKLNPDFIELHIALPFYGTDLYHLAKKEGLVDDKTLGKDYFKAPTIGTKYLSIEELQKFRNKTLVRFYTRPIYILRKIADSLLRPKVIKNYFKYGLRLLSFK